MYLHQTEAAPKLGLIKAKVALVKAPHIIAKVAVAKEVKAKTKIAVAKSFAAVRFYYYYQLRFKGKTKIIYLYSNGIGQSNKTCCIECHNGSISCR